MPDEAVSVMEADDEVTTLPPESSTWTTGWVLKSTPLVELPGEVVKTSLVADPVDSEKVLEVAPVSPLEAAVEAVARAGGPRGAPGESGHAARRRSSGLVVQLNVPDEAVSVMEADEELTRLPPESSTLTTGWAVKATPLVELPGEVVKTSLVADPVDNEKAAEVAPVSPVEAAVRL